MKPILQLLRDQHDRLSHKRAIAVFVVLFFAGVLVYLLAKDSSSMHIGTLIDALTTIACIAMGSTAVEKFSSKKPRTANVPKNTNNEDSL